MSEDAPMPGRIDGASAQSAVRPSTPPIGTGATVIETERTGRLVSIGHHNLGIYFSYEWWRCVDCGTEFPEIDLAIRCNGYRISRCPWCKPDSQPWRGGRGK